jgi:hypothetical protein
MRKSFDGLHALVREHLELDAFAGHVFVFASRLIQKASFKHLSLDQKKCLQAAIRSYQQGRPLTGEEAAVVTAFDAATEQACRKAGITAAEYRGCL